jgi:hypothetical protein
MPRSSAACLCQALLESCPAGGSKSSDGGGVAIGGAHNAQMSETTGTLEDGGNAHSTFNTTHSNGGAGLINKVTLALQSSSQICCMLTLSCYLSHISCKHMHF